MSEGVIEWVGGWARFFSFAWSRQAVVSGYPWCSGGSKYMSFQIKPQEEHNFSRVCVILPRLNTRWRLSLRGVGRA